MAKRISELDVLEVATGNEYIPVAINGNNFKISISFLKSIVTALDIGLGNVDNTSDLNKPLSDATIEALNSKVELQAVLDLLVQKANTLHQHSIGDVAGLVDALNALATKQHSHSVDEIGSLNSIIDSLQQSIMSKANSMHQHLSIDITDFRERVLAITSEPGAVVADVTAGSMEW